MTEFLHDKFVIAVLAYVFGLGVVVGLLVCLDHAHKRGNQ